MRARRLLQLGVTLAVAAAALAATVSAIAVGQSGNNAGPAIRLSELGGVWRSRGYGWVWAVENTKVSMYDESGAFCIESEQEEIEPDDRNTTLFVSADGRTLKVLLEEDDYYYTFDRIPGLPASCLDEPRSDPLSVFDAAAETLAAHYAFFEARGIDWPRVVVAERARVTAKTTDRQLFGALSRLLSHFPDSHVSLEGEIDGRDFSYEPAGRAARSTERRAADAGVASVGCWNPAIARRFLGDAARTSDAGDMTYGLIGGDVGYLRVDSMQANSMEAMDRAMDKVMALFRNAERVVVDVSANGGGYDAIARRIAGRFAAARAIGYFKFAGDSRVEEPPQAIYVTPSAGARYTGPVYVIAGPRTVSAAEVFVLAMRALPNVIQVGETTDGSLSDILSKPLPNGWTLTLSNEVYLDSKGVAWEAEGIPPHINARIAKAPATECIDALLRFIDRIRSLPGRDQAGNRAMRRSRPRLATGKRIPSLPASSDRSARPCFQKIRDQRRWA